MVWGRELIELTLNRKNEGANAFWVGHPSDEAKRIYYPRLGISAPDDMGGDGEENTMLLLTTTGGKPEVDFALKIGSDMVWISPENEAVYWKHPEGKPMWDCFEGKRESLASEGVFANVRDVSEIEDFDWPNPDYIDFAALLENVKYAYDKGLAVFGGMWCPFYHVVADFFGMENYFVLMHSNPEIVHAVTERVVSFYLEANRRCLSLIGSYLSAAFFGNDLGTQQSMMISPACFDEFIYPYMKRIIAGIKDARLKVAIHSCGAIEPLIPKFIAAGIEILHPLQALAKGMDAETLAKYAKDLIFLGGVDTQSLLPFGSPAQVREEVARLKSVFGPGFIVSPSHEAILPNVPFENVVAMREAAKA